MLYHDTLTCYGLLEPEDAFREDVHVYLHWRGWEERFSPSEARAFYNIMAHSGKCKILRAGQGSDVARHLQADPS